MSLDYTQLSRTLAYALRHKPHRYALILDENGWVAVEDVLAALHKERRDWQNLTEADLVKMNEQASKKRYEIAGGRIRALYGHSTAQKVEKTPAAPPQILYHGTNDRVLETILQNGLKPMSRQYVHFATDPQMAAEVASRRVGKVVILEILADEAYRNGVAFYLGNENVWLADFVPPKFIRVMAEE